MNKLDRDKIDILKEDIVPYVYFVCSMAHESMHGALGAKSDFIGGIFDRWINIIPESIVFNKLILPKVKKKTATEKTISVYSDFYKYDPKKVGIAPDVLGIKIDEKVVPFVKYDDTKAKGLFWVVQEDCPQIEVKSFKGKQYMVSLRDQNYKDKFLVMVEMNLNPDYLLPFFNKEIFTDEHMKKLTMPQEFIVSNKENSLSQTETVEFDKAVFGTVQLLIATTASEFMGVALKLSKGEIPRYFVKISQRKQLVKAENMCPNKSLSDYCDEQASKLFRFNQNWYELFSNQNEKTLDIYIENAEKLFIIKKTNNSIAVLATEDANINGFKLAKGSQYNIEFGTFGTIAGAEYFINKGLLQYLPNREQKMIDALAKVIKDNDN